MKALLVEDDPDLRALVTTVLRDRNHEVAAFADAEGAWEAYQRHRHPLVLVDWRLPGMDGSELSRLIRAMPGGDTTAILMMTARTASEDLAAALAAGVSDYLTKPFELADLEVRLSIAETHHEMLAGRAGLLERERIAATRIRTLVALAIDAQTSDDEEGVFQAVGAAIVGNGLNCHIATLEATRDEEAGLVIRHAALTDPNLREPIEQRLGRPIVGLWLDPKATEAYRACCGRGAATLLPDAGVWLQEALPWLDQRAARALGRLRQMGQGICAPISDGRVVLGALSVWGQTLSDLDVPAVELLGRVAGAALAAQRLRAGDRARARLDGALLLARTAAHELSTALGLAAGYADLLAAHPAVQADRTLAEYAREAQEGAAAAARTLSRFQHVIRLEETASPLGGDKGVLDLERSTNPPSNSAP